MSLMIGLTGKRISAGGGAQFHSPVGLESTASGSGGALFEGAC